METWNMFNGTDVLLAAAGLIGLSSAVIVMATATSKVNDREVELRKRIDKVLAQLESENEEK